MFLYITERFPSARKQCCTMFTVTIAAQRVHPVSTRSSRMSEKCFFFHKEKNILRC